jgi:hypothetical protein
LEKEEGGNILIPEEDIIKLQNAHKLNVDEMSQKI